MDDLPEWVTPLYPGRSDEDRGPFRHKIKTRLLSLLLLGQSRSLSVLCTPTVSTLPEGEIVEL